MKIEYGENKVGINNNEFDLHKSLLYIIWLKA